jgi:hypothetical protein
VKIEPQTKSIAAMFERVRKSEAALRKKAGKHKCIKEELGTLGPVNGDWEQVDYWCKLCHKDMGRKIRKKREK